METSYVVHVRCGNMENCDIHEKNVDKLTLSAWYVPVTHTHTPFKNDMNIYK